MQITLTDMQTCGTICFPILIQVKVYCDIFLVFVYSLRTKEILKL